MTAGKRHAPLTTETWRKLKGYGDLSGDKCRKCKGWLRRYPVYSGDVCGRCLDGDQMLHRL